MAPVYLLSRISPLQQTPVSKNRETEPEEAKESSKKARERVGGGEYERSADPSSGEKRSEERVELAEKGERGEQGDKCREAKGRKGLPHECLRGSGAAYGTTRDTLARPGLHDYFAFRPNVNRIVRFSSIWFCVRVLLHSSSRIITSHMVLNTGSNFSMGNL